MLFGPFISIQFDLFFQVNIFFVENNQSSQHGQLFLGGFEWSNYHVRSMWIKTKGTYSNWQILFDVAGARTSKYAFKDTEYIDHRSVEWMRLKYKAFSWLVVSNMFYVHSLFGEDFQFWFIFFKVGWNHQLVSKYGCFLKYVPPNHPF